ncbi:MAG: leucine-rich repeat domain-containing protein, partial [Bacteroidales bacterium]|nr:leucine-rich repeat domain-containing protein [Bacteroidales bacterium]
GSSAFAYCSGLTSVTIPNSVTSIGGGAFAYCSGLTSVVWNAKNCADFAQYYDYSSSKYYYGPFDDSASKITSFTFGSEVEHIPAYLCYGMENLTSVTIPNSVTSIGEKAFRGCSGLTSVTIPNSVTSIGMYAFEGCSGLTSVLWNAKNYADFSSRDYAPFYNIKSQITSFTFGSEVEHIPAYLCYGMENLTSVTIPNNVTSIGGAAFYGCSGLTSVTIPNSVTSIGYGAFYYCSGLTAVTIGNSVTSIGKNTFYECSGLTSVVWNAKNCADFAEYYDEYDYYGPFYNIASQITSFTFGSAVEHIPAYLCYDMKNLTSVTIPNSVTSIGYYAFEGCTALHEITALPTVPPTCGSNAFYNVPTDVTLRCPCASREAYQAADTWSQFSNVTLTDFPNVTLLADEEHGSVQVEDRICESKSIVISATPQIGYVFARWSDGNTENPRTILLTHDITLTAEFGLAYSGKCGDNLYWEYKQNKLFITGSGDMYEFTVETRPWKLLLADIESIEISAGTTSIGESAFADCSGLTSVTIGNSVTSIGEGAFAGCSGLTSVTIPNSVTSIGGWAFDGCSGLTSVTIPNSVTSIGDGAFEGCSGLTSVTIPNSVTSIGEEAFSGCTKLINIVCYAAEPPSCDASVFANYNVFLKVPCNNLMAYQTHVCWGSFKYISCIGSEEVQVTEFSVTPSTNEALFTWPAEPNAATYELVISKDGVVFCTLTFNASGQLMGIAFAPGANTAATTATSGFQFTVTGLDEASHYTYTFDAKDAGGSVVKHYAGEFNTDGSVGLGQIELAGLYTQAGRIVCEGEFRIYDLLGRDVTRLNGSLCGVYVVKTANAAVKVVVK